MFFGLIDLLAFAMREAFHATLLLETGWGLLFFFLVAVPLVAVAVRASAVFSSALAQVALVAVAVIAAAVLSASPEHMLVAAGLLGTVAALVVLAGDRPWAVMAKWRWSAVPGVLVILALAPCLAYAWEAARMTGSTAVIDVMWGLDHWPVQAALPLALLLTGALAAGHPPGWRLPTWSAGIAAVWFAVVCSLEPNLAGSVSRPWATVTFLWSAAFIAATHLTARRARLVQPRHPPG
ncbi:MAG TPA: hypothetical protein VGR11_04980 [Solirubrobacteraceae bacterium]|nr:hypothetical protein [Solirubrobacteraceae bacterium]